MTVFLADNFSGAAGTLVSAHVPDVTPTGNTWAPNGNLVPRLDGLDEIIIPNPFPFGDIAIARYQALPNIGDFRIQWTLQCRFAGNLLGDGNFNNILVVILSGANWTFYFRLNDFGGAPSARIETSNSAGVTYPIAPYGAAGSPVLFEVGWKDGVAYLLIDNALIGSYEVARPGVNPLSQIEIDMVTPYGPNTRDVPDYGFIGLSINDNFPVPPPPPAPFIRNERIKLINNSRWLTGSYVPLTKRPTGLAAPMTAKQKSLLKRAYK